MATFTAIATGIGMAATAGTTAGSFAQAGKQRRLAKEARMEADKAMASARAKLDVNFLEAVAIQKEPYELQREATLQAAATALEGVREGDVRGAAAGAGRVALATQQGTSEQRAAMSKELQALEMATAQEESRLRDIGVQLDLQEVQGAQQAVADAEAAKRQAIQQGAQGLVSLGQQAAAAAPLYAKNQGAKAVTKLVRQNPGIQQEIAKSLPEVAGMVSGEFQDYMIQNFTPDQIKSFAMAGQGMSTPGIQTNVMGGSTVGLPQRGVDFYLTPEIGQPVDYQFQNPFNINVLQPTPIQITDFQNIIR